MLKGSQIKLSTFFPWTSILCGNNFAAKVSRNILWWAYYRKILFRFAKNLWNLFNSLEGGLLWFWCILCNRLWSWNMMSDSYGLMRKGRGRFWSFCSRRKLGGLFHLSVRPTHNVYTKDCVWKVLKPSFLVKLLLSFLLFLLLPELCDMVRQLSRLNYLAPPLLPTPKQI